MRKALFACAAFALSGTSQAALITLDFIVTASDFENLVGGGAVAPIDPVSGRFKVVFDNDSAVGPTTSGLTVSGFSLPIAPQFAYLKDSDIITIADRIDSNGSFTVSTGQDDFGFFIFDASTAPTFSSFLYSSTNSTGIFRARSLAAAPAVPEPGTWAMFIAGFALFGSALRVRRYKLRYS